MRSPSPPATPTRQKTWSRASRSTWQGKRVRPRSRAAARAASVVQAVQNTGMVAASNLQAVSKGENDPVASNDTAAGRELNRRIEIEIDY